MIPLPPVLRMLQQTGARRLAMDILGAELLEAARFQIRRPVKFRTLLR